MPDDSVAQLVEQLTLNQWAVGSSPTGVTGREGATRVAPFSWEEGAGGGFFAVFAGMCFEVKDLCVIFA